MDPENLIGLWSGALIAAATGDQKAGRELAKKWEDAELADAEAQYYMGSMYCINGDVSSCVRAVTRAVDRGYFNYPNLKGDRFLEAAHGDINFEAVVELARTKSETFRARLGTQQ